jgi:hypothetical protein
LLPLSQAADEERARHQVAGVKPWGSTVEDFLIEYLNGAVAFSIKQLPLFSSKGGQRNNAHRSAGPFFLTSGAAVSWILFFLAQQVSKQSSDFSYFITKLVELNRCAVI